MQRIQLNLPFRGARDYLHGTDLYHRIMEAVGGGLPDGPLHWQFHSLLRKQPDLILDVDGMAEWRQRPDYRGEGKLGGPGGAKYLVMLESDRPVEGRKDCNEKEVVREAVVDTGERSVGLLNPSVGTAVENVVFLNKLLHFKVLPEVVASWLFVKLELNRRLPTAIDREMKLVMRQILGNRFTKTEILIGGSSYGFIVFSTAK